jgi:formylglycine-generating enzyme required for sulfatase activity
VGIVATFLAAAAIGILLLGRPPDAPPPSTASSAVSGYEKPVLTVADLGKLLVRLEAGGDAMLVARESLTAVVDPQVVDPESLPEEVHAVIWYAMRVTKYEVTQGQYAEFLRDLEAHRDLVPKGWIEGSKEPSVDPILDHVPRAWLVKDDHGRPTGWSLEDSRTPIANWPVSDVTFGDAQEFAKWASKKTGLDLHLPNYLEWMRAARGGRLDYVWPWGNEPQKYACNHAASWPEKGQPNPVQFLYEPLDGPFAGGKTAEGLYAMAGNVAEWADDCDFELYPPDRPVEIHWKPSSTGYVFAYGGSYLRGIDDCHVDSWVSLGRDDRRPDLGFRLIERVR